MASFFFSNDDASPEQVSSEADVKRPVLRFIKGGAPSADMTQASEDTPSGHGLRRAEVVPPSLFSRSRPLWAAWAVGFWYWLWDMDDSSPRTPAPTAGLRKIKVEFNSALWDMQSMRANQIRSMIEQARSLRELWHLRADVFRVVSVHRGQIEAQQRLDALDSHFPVRSSARSDSTRNSKVTSW